MRCYLYGPTSVRKCIKMPIDRLVIDSRGIEAVGPLQVILLARLINERKSLFPGGEESLSAPLTLRRKRQAKEDRSPREQPGIRPPSAHRRTGTQKIFPRSPRSIARRASADKMGLLHSKHSPTFKQRTLRQVIGKHQLSRNLGLSRLFCILSIRLLLDDSMMSKTVNQYHAWLQLASFNSY